MLRCSYLGINLPNNFRLNPVNPAIRPSLAGVVCVLAAFDGDEGRFGVFAQLFHQQWQVAGGA